MAEDSAGGKAGRVMLSSQSSIPADGQTQARISIRVSYDDGTPVSGATATLQEVSPNLSQAPAITQPGATNADGRSVGLVTSSVPVTLHLQVSVTAPAKDPEHPGFTENSGSPLRILFFSDLRTVVMVPGGRLRATLYQGNSPASGFSGKAKEALGLGIEIKVKPESEPQSRPAPYALFKGTVPQLEFTFIPTIDVF